MLEKGRKVSLFFFFFFFNIKAFQLLVIVVRKNSFKCMVCFPNLFFLRTMINRCLEGGAEEFILKPVQLSDMKKLHPHLLRSLNSRLSHTSSSSSTITTNNNNSNNNSNRNNEDNNNNGNSSSKRKAMSPPPEKRAKFRGLTVL